MFKHAASGREPSYRSWMTSSRRSLDLVEMVILEVSLHSAELFNHASAKGSKRATSPQVLSLSE